MVQYLPLCHCTGTRDLPGHPDEMWAENSLVIDSI
jgi:hypothetical protein